MTVREIVIEKLKAMGADGLCDGNCGCKLNDFMPCNEVQPTCEAAKVSKEKREGYDFVMKPI